MKKYLIIILFTIICLTGCEEKVYVENPEVININKEEFEVFSDVYLYDIIDNPNKLEIVTDNYQIDTEEIGKKTHEIFPASTFRQTQGK